MATNDVHHTDVEFRLICIVCNWIVIKSQTRSFENSIMPISRLCHSLTIVLVTNGNSMWALRNSSNRMSYRINLQTDRPPMRAFCISESRMSFRINLRAACRDASLSSSASWLLEIATLSLAARSHPRSTQPFIPLKLNTSCFSPCIVGWKQARFSLRHKKQYLFMPRSSPSAIAKPESWTRPFHCIIS